MMYRRIEEDAHDQKEDEIQRHIIPGSWNIIQTYFDDTDDQQAHHDRDQNRNQVHVTTPHEGEMGDRPWDRPNHGAADYDKRKDVTKLLQVKIEDAYLP